VSLAYLISKKKKAKIKKVFQWWMEEQPAAATGSDAVGRGSRPDRVTGSKKEYDCELRPAFEFIKDLIFHFLFQNRK